jgi:hypothetical protein
LTNPILNQPGALHGISKAEGNSRQNTLLSLKKKMVPPTRIERAARGLGRRFYLPGETTSAHTVHEKPNRDKGVQLLL